MATGGGGEATTSTSTGSSGCDGCVAGDACEPGDAPAACGVDGESCAVCATGNPCEVATCDVGVCATERLEDATPCDAGDGPASGACVEGVCEDAPEDCLNGDDDNGDDLVDCADPFCGEFTCISDAPGVDWDGPFAVYWGEQAVECAGVWGQLERGDLRAGLVVPPASCPLCSCEVGDCSVSFQHLDGVTAGCMGGDSQEVLLSTVNECLQVGDDALQAANGAVSDALDVCAATFDSEPMIDAADFTEVLTVCRSDGAVGGGCDQGDGCRANAPALDPATGGLCVIADGFDATCPAKFPEGPFYAGTGVDDARFCAPCGCEEASCGGQIRLYTNDTCSNCNGQGAGCGVAIDVDQPGDCSGLVAPFESGSVFASWRRTGAAQNPSCTPTTSDIVDEPHVQGLVTICCREPL